MSPVVFDCNVILAGIGWNGSARLCLKLVAQRRLMVCVTEAILAEYDRVIPERLRVDVPGLDPEPKLVWLRAQAKRFEAAPLGKRRSRDPKDDPYLACALAARAKWIISYDRDLLDLEKPFGIEIIRPAELLRRTQ